jgi:hypothetical protein
LTEQEQEMATSTMTENMVSKEKCTQVSLEIEAAIMDIFAKHDLKVTKRASKYGDNYEFKIVAEAQMISEDGINLASPDVIYYNRFGHTAYLGVSIQDMVQTHSPYRHEVRERWQNLRFRRRSVAWEKQNLRCLSRRAKKTFVFSDAIIKFMNSKSSIYLTK